MSGMDGLISVQYILNSTEDKSVNLCTVKTNIQDCSGKNSDARKEIVDYQLNQIYPLGSTTIIYYNVDDYSDCSLTSYSPKHDPSDMGKESRLR